MAADAKKPSAKLKAKAKERQEAAEPVAATSAPQPAAPPAGPSLVSFTIDAENGRVRGVEMIDPAGTRHPLTRQERASFVDSDDKPTLQAILEQTFEAGIACVLGAEEDDTPESADDVALRRILLKPMIDKSRARRLMRREVLNRAIVRTLIEEAGRAGATAPPPSTQPGAEGP
jgi:hypothetical protein